MNPRRLVPWILAIALAAGVGACESDGGSGTLKVAMTDGPFPATAGCLAAAVVRVEAIETHEVDSGDAFLLIPFLDGETIDLDLLDLRNGLSADVAVGSLPTGRYDQVRIVISQATLLFTDGTSRDFKVPSGETSGIKVSIAPAIVVAANGTTLLLLDVDLARSFHLTGAGGDPTCEDLKDGKGKAIFRPTVRAVNLATSGVLSGIVTDEDGNPVADVEVTVRVAGADAGAEAVAVTLTSPAGLPNAAAGTYALYVEPGTYDVRVRPQGSDDAVLVLTGVPVASATITADQDIILH
jgi:hypothetical protein